MKQMNDRQFEAFLREFQPPDPRPLPAPASTILWRRLAAAAVVLAGCASMWFASHTAPEGIVLTNQVNLLLVPEDAPGARRLSVVRLTQLAQDDPRRLGAVLDAASRQILPGFQGKGSTLAVLAKE